jgi:hypothetical protein
MVTYAEEDDCLGLCEARTLRGGDYFGDRNDGRGGAADGFREGGGDAIF